MEQGTLALSLNGLPISLLSRESRRSLTFRTVPSEPSTTPVGPGVGAPASMERCFTQALRHSSSKARRLPWRRLLLLAVAALSVLLVLRTTVAPRFSEAHTTHRKQLNDAQPQSQLWPMPAHLVTMLRRLLKRLEVAPSLGVTEVNDNPPRQWEANWLLRGAPNPAGLWDQAALMRSAPFPIGSAEQLCGILGGPKVKEIAVVGNGPLSAAQRAAANAADRVVRFNAVNNRMAGEPVHVWVSRWNAQRPVNFWGFKQLGLIEVDELLGFAQGILLVGGPRSGRMADAVDDLRALFPALPINKVMQVNITGYWDLYNRVLSNSSSLEEHDAMPSTGLLGLLAVLGCMGRGQRLAIYGFNWSAKSYYLHRMGAEAHIVARLLAGHGAALHAPPCPGALYSCNPSCDTKDFRLAVDGPDAQCADRALARRAAEAASVARGHEGHGDDAYFEDFELLADDADGRPTDGPNAPFMSDSLLVDARLTGGAGLPWDGTGLPWNAASGDRRSAAETGPVALGAAVSGDTPGARHVDLRRAPSGLRFSQAAASTGPVHHRASALITPVGDKS